MSSSNAPSLTFEPYPPTNMTGSFLRSGRRSGPPIGSDPSAAVGTGAVRISLGRSSVRGIGLEVGGWPAPFGAGGRPSSALAANPPAERRASATKDPRRNSPGDTRRSQQNNAQEAHRT